MLLLDKKIVLGITGGIAAYKCCELARLFIKEGANVQVIMTKSAKKLVSKTTLEALTHNKIYTKVFTNKEWKKITHIDIVKNADVFLVAPATANTLAKIAHGICNDMLTTSILAATCPKVVAPAMNSNMFENVATQDNLHILKSRGFFIIPPAVGDLACKDKGIGRMREPIEIFNFIVELLNNRDKLPFFKKDFLEYKEAEKLALTQTKMIEDHHENALEIVITAGPTVEDIDPVRMITNKSSGKMGYALAQAALNLGHKVTLISGPVSLDPIPGVNLVKVRSADDMLIAAEQYADKANIFIGCAAVADFKVDKIADLKIKKSDADTFLELKLVKNKDIIASIAKREAKRPFCVGFAAETNNGEEYAKKKLESKHLDMIVLNDVSNKEIGFNSDSNAVSVFTNKNEQIIFEKEQKITLAQKLMKLIIKKYLNIK